ncbi:ACP S-malonyltransferase [Arenicella sp. 4NH20-0111]|uniref:ACP S-malonyltransferase n=1 Tax=Arenicella sp. 4NH20-0111 TaxID=3127648 RepID=UPI00310BF2AC
MSLAIVFPGQGSQTIGMMSQLAQNYPIVKDLYTEASDVLGIDMWQLTQAGPIEELSKTENTQPALLIAGVAAWNIWKSEGGALPDLMAGHSLGEYTALVCSDAISFTDGVTLVRDRGRYMQGAVAEGEGAMAAIIGLTDDEVIRVCAEIAENDVLQAVNFNAPGQVVIAGSAAAIERAAPAMKEAGAKRALALPVSIPAHSSLMSPASEQLAERLNGIEVALPNIPVLHNCNVSFAESADQVKTNLVTQLDSPVRWVESVEKMKNEGVEHFVESGPGRVLGGMIKRIARGATVSTMDNLDTIQELTKTS